MPFTFAHPAIVLPLGKIRNWHLPMSALVTGSVTPDFEYFIRMKLTGRYSHSIAGMFLLDLPVAIALILIFHLLVKGPLTDNLPSYFKSRLLDLKQFNFLKYLTRHYHVVIACLLLGIGSHILWDSFTHSKEYFVMKFEIFSTPVSFFDVLTMPLYRWLQHTSTAVGFICIGIVFHRTPARATHTSVTFRFWALMVCVSLVSFLIRASMGFEYYGDVVATAISAMCIGLILSSIATRYTHG